MHQTNSPASVFWERFSKNRAAKISLWSLFVLILLSLAATLWLPDNSPAANRQIPEIALQKPFFRARVLSPSATNSYLPITNYTLRGDSLYADIFQSTTQSIPAAFHQKDLVKHSSAQHDPYTTTFYYPLGTDYLGRCVFSRLILGLRVSLTIGGVAVLISVVLGVFVGSIAGYWGGKLDDFISFIINILWAIPTLLWVFVLLIILGKGYWQLFTAIGLTMWIEVARLVRGEVMRIKVLPYIEAAKSFGLSDGRILWRHILPNVAGSVAVVAASNFASAVLIESGLSYLGLGIQPPTPSWGNMLSENYGLLLSDTPYPALFPALFIAILVLFLNIIGAAMRDAFAVQ